MLREHLRAGQPRKLAQEAFRQMLRLGDAALPTAIEMASSPHWPERKAAYCLLRRWEKLTADQKGRAAKDSSVAVRHAAEWESSYYEPHPVWGRPSRKA